MGTYINPAVVEHQTDEGGADAGVALDGLLYLFPHGALHARVHVGGLCASVGGRLPGRTGQQQAQRQQGGAGVNPGHLNSISSSSLLG